MPDQTRDLTLSQLYTAVTFLVVSGLQLDISVERVR